MMNRYAKVVFTAFLCLMICLLPLKSANAQETGNYKLICTKGMLLTDEYSLSAGKAAIVEDIDFALCPNSYAVLHSDSGLVDIAQKSWVTLKEDGTLYVKEGVVAFDAINNDIYVETGTQKATVKKGSRLTVRVDDYGNAFNYCTSGSATLYSKLNDREMILNSGEYIAVTVKRGFRKLKEISDDDVKKLGIVFAEENELSNIAICDFDEINGIMCDFTRDGDIAKLSSGRAYLLTPEEGTVISSHTMYLDCDDNAAVLCVYDTKLNLIANSLDETRANKPNVTVLSGDDDEKYIVCAYSQNEAEYSLRQIKYESTLDKVFDMAKSFVLPILAALVLFAIYEIVGSKVKKKPKF